MLREEHSEHFAEHWTQSYEESSKNPDTQTQFELKSSLFDPTTQEVQLETESQLRQGCTHA